MKNLRKEDLEKMNFVQLTGIEIGLEAEMHELKQVCLYNMAKARKANNIALMKRWLAAYKEVLQALEEIE